MSVRPARKCASLRTVETYWNLPRFTCARCGIVARTERAHIIDRCYGGLDVVPNIVPLCRRCHDDMPSFASGDEPLALLWCSSDDDTRWFAFAIWAIALLGDTSGWTVADWRNMDSDAAVRSMERQLVSLYESYTIEPFRTAA